MKKKIKSKRNVYLVLALSMSLSGLFEIRTASAEQESVKSSTNLFSVVGLVDFYTPSVDSTNSNFSSLTNSSKMGTGLGLLRESPLAGPLNLELGLLLLHRQNTFKSSIFDYVQSSNWLVLPVGAKFRFLDYFALGVGPYIAYRVGDISNDFSVGSGATASFATTSQEKFEIGFQASGSGTVPINQIVGILFEIRFLRGISNLSNDTTTSIKSADLIGLVGVQFNY
jgi:hypothetical protein